MWIEPDWRLVLSVATPVSAVLLTGLLRSGGSTGRLQRLIRFEVEIRKELHDARKDDPLADKDLEDALGKLTRARVALYIDRYMTTKPARSRDRKRKWGGIGLLVVTVILTTLFGAAPNFGIPFPAQVGLLICGAFTGVIGGVLLGPTAHRRVIRMVRSDYMATLERLAQEVYKQRKWPDRTAEEDPPES